ncbi:MAG: methyltransferase domain-containing protein [Opitutales bacterium]|nr:methyltransferase domain-containing protein [Opitutales bacterium]
MDRFQILNDTSRMRHPEIFQDLQLLFEEQKPRKILSFGCSKGDECFDLSLQFPGAAVIGVDTDENVLRQAIDKYDCENIHFYKSDYNTIIENAPYDLIVANSVFCIWPKRDDNSIEFESFERTIALIAVSLRFGGILCLFNSEYLLQQTVVRDCFTPIAAVHQMFSGFVDRQNVENGETYSPLFRYKGKILDVKEIRKIYGGPMQELEFVGYKGVKSDGVELSDSLKCLYFRRNTHNLIFDQLNQLDASRKTVLRSSDRYYWCSSFFDFRGKSWALLSYWPASEGFQGFLRYSKIGLVEIEGGRAIGPLKQVETEWPEWGQVMQHGPSILKVLDRYLLFYTGSVGPTLEDIQNNRNVGWVETSDLVGWDARALPVFRLADFGEGCFSISNPFPVCAEDRLFLFIKVSCKVDGKIIATYRLAESNLDEVSFRLLPEVCIGGTLGSVEDGHCFFWKGFWYFLCVDFEGVYNGSSAKKLLSTWISRDLRKWTPVVTLIPANLFIRYDSQTTREVARLERPSIYWVNKEAGEGIFYCAILPKNNGNSFIQGFPFSLRN